MKPVLVAYATRHGHTAHVAEHVAEKLRAKGQPVELVDLGKITALEVAGYSRVILAASIHTGKHEPETIEFVKKHRRELYAVPTAFLSISMTEVRAEDEMRPPAEREEASHLVDAMMEQFFADTGWRPREKKPVGGALLYSKYNFVIRFVMKQIAKAQHGATDTSRDYDYTDWPALDRFIDGLESPALGE